VQQLNSAAEAGAAPNTTNEPSASPPALAGEPSYGAPCADRIIACGAAASSHSPNRNRRLPISIALIKWPKLAHRRLRLGEGRDGRSGALVAKVPGPPDRPPQAASARAREGRQAAERIPLGIICMLIATILFAGSSALSKWLVATYPIGQMLFMRAAAALVGSSLVILPVTGLAVFRTKRLRDHTLRSVSQACAQSFLVIAFSLMPLASAVAINFSAPLFATVAAIVFLKETVGPVRWGALIAGFLGVLLVTAPGADTLQLGSLFALANAVLFGTVTVGVRRMTSTESAETLTMYQMLFLTGFFAAALPFGWVTPSLPDFGAMVVNGLGNALGQYLWTRALHLAPTSAVAPFNYFSLVWAIILGFLVWGDVPSATLLMGSAIVVGTGMFLLWHESRGR
jgi:drug/metabolite transporter (DMT)-like permease